MPYFHDDDIQENKMIEGEGPILILIHGTGSTADINFDALKGDRWWQPGSIFDEWLCERIKCRSGRNLTSDDVLRFVWSGANSEEAREKAAGALWKVIRPLEEAGRPISIVAHSHGGNIARRACELAAFSSNSASATPWSVVCIGTPFFHYSLFGGALGVLWRLTVLCFWWAVFYWVPNLLHLKLWGLGQDWYYLSFGAIGLFYVFVFVDGCCRLDLRRYRDPCRFRARASFVNFYSRLDEAIIALKSLNRTVRLMRQGDREVKWVSSPLGCVYAVNLILCAIATVLVILGTMAGVASMDDLFDMVGLVFLLLGGVVVLSAFFGGIFFLLDWIFTSRLRKLAFGSDRGTPMSRVEAFPWVGGEEIAVPLPLVVETAAEVYIANHTASIWSKIRFGLTPHAPLLNQNIREVTERTLTGDELVHTVYYRIEEFVDLVASHLVNSGQWVSTARYDN